jgi:hypothetical protein
MAHLDGILDVLEAMTITGYSMPVYRGSTLKNAVETADLPVRIISAIGIQSNRVRALTLGGGHLIQTDWTINDIALLRGAGLGIGLRDIAPGMEGYMSAYHDSLRTIVNPAWKIITVSMRAQVQEWPQASGRYYDVVTAQLTISDIIQ